MNYLIFAAFIVVAGALVYRWYSFKTSSSTPSGE